MTNWRNTGRRALPRKCTNSTLPKNTSKTPALAAKENVMLSLLEEDTGLRGLIS
ncbi:hypothetical protein D9M73_273530 [compost metagenome]